jgi:hypothetical protein
MRQLSISFTQPGTARIENPGNTNWAGKVAGMGEAKCIQKKSIETSCKVAMKEIRGKKITEMLGV